MTDREYIKKKKQILQKYAKLDLMLEKQIFDIPEYKLSTNLKSSVVWKRDTPIFDEKGLYNPTLES